MVKSVKRGGVLVFFSSYEYLNKCKIIWEQNGTVNKFISLEKETIFDYKHDNESLIENGKKNNNLLLFTVHRGKNSEGINFPDDEARMVIYVGIPFPCFVDIKVKLKMNYLNKKIKKEKDGINGRDWYKNEGMIAVNQSLGRLLRSKDDYGVMICFGKEFKSYKSKLSNWIQKNISIKLEENKQIFYQKIKTFLENFQNNNNDGNHDNNINYNDNNNINNFNNNLIKGNKINHENQEKNEIKLNVKEENKIIELIEEENKK